MNIQNIASLAEQLEGLGLKNSGYALLKRICFKPAAFTLSQKIEKEKDQLSIQLFFEKDRKQDEYVLMYYDAILQKEIASVSVIINGVSTAILEKTMAEIDWKASFDINTKKQWSVEDKASWEKEQKVEAVIEDLNELENCEDGRTIAVGLKLKYWVGASYQELMGSISPIKSKSEVTQRFYFFQGLTGITVDEAYRFLQNRWLEKQMLAKRKQADNSQVEEAGNDSQVSSGSSLLVKKRLNNVKRPKRQQK